MGREAPALCEASEVPLTVRAVQEWWGANNGDVTLCRNRQKSHQKLNGNFRTDMRVFCLEPKQRLARKLAAVLPQVLAAVCLPRSDAPPLAVYDLDQIKAGATEEERAELFIQHVENNSENRTLVDAVRVAVEKAKRGDILRSYGASHRIWSCLRMVFRILVILSFWPISGLYVLLPFYAATQEVHLVLNNCRQSSVYWHKFSSRGNWSDMQERLVEKIFVLLSKLEEMDMMCLPDWSEHVHTLIKGSWKLQWISYPSSPFTEQERLQTEAIFAAQLNHYELGFRPFENIDVYYFLLSLIWAVVLFTLLRYRLCAFICELHL